MKQITAFSLVLLLILAGCSFGKASKDISQPSGTAMTSEGAMSTDEYKAFVRSMDTQISAAMTRVDTGIKAYREKTRTEAEFISDVDYAISQLTLVVSAFSTAKPPISLVNGHIMAVEGVTLMKEGFVSMKTAVADKDNDAYKNAVEQFATGLKKLQEANTEFKSKIQGGFALTV